jgi:hypothetical protein
LPQGFAAPPPLPPTDQAMPPLPPTDQASSMLQTDAAPGHGIMQTTLARKRWGQ